MLLENWSPKYKRYVRKFLLDTDKEINKCLLKRSY